MPNIIKGFNCLFLVIFFSQLTYSQVLINSGSSLNLSTNGKVYDVEYLPVLNMYVVVGQFTAIGSTTCSNLAFLDPDFTVNTTFTNHANIDPGANGAIHAVESYRYSLGGGNYNTAIYLGGTFTQFKDSSQTAAVRLDIVDNGFSATGGPTINDWNPDFDYNFIFDITIWSNRVVYTGEFSKIHSTTTQNYRNKIAIFNANSGTDYTTIQDYDGLSGVSNEHVWNIICPNSYMYLAADADRFIKLNPATNIVGGPTPIDNSVDLVKLNDSLLVVGYNHSSGGGFGIQAIAVIRSLDMTVKTNHAFSLFHPSTGSTFSLDTYDGTLYITNDNSIKRFEQEDIDLANGILAAQTLPLGSTGSLNHNDIIDPWTSFPDNYKSNIMIERNIMFVSFPNMTSASGQPRQRFAAYCLRPINQGGFVAPDSTICQGDTVTYTIGAATYADGYEWSYTGTGLDMEWVLPGEEVSDTTILPSIELAILENFTPGLLTVTPYSTCGGNTVGGAKVYGKPINMNLSFNSIPNADAGLDSVITCYTDSISLVGNSITPGVNYYWNQVLNPLGTNYAGQNYVAHDSDWYVLKVEGPDGCLGFDTTYVDIDTLRPNFNPIVTDVLGCDETLYFLGVCNNGTDTLSWWQKEGNPTILPNPLPCSSPGFYNFYTQFSGNGCIDSSSIFVGQNIDLPNIAISGYTIPSLGVPIEYLTCANLSFSMQAYSDTANTAVNWVGQDTLNPVGDTQVFSDTGVYYIHAVNNDNNCQNFIAIIVGENKTPPPAPLLSSSGNGLNCSNDSLILTGTTTAIDTLLTWTGPSISPSGNPVSVFNPGYYTFTVVRNDNGCSAADSILVIQDNSIDLITTNDTVGCDQDQLDLNVSYVGNISGITYLWDNGSSNNVATYTAGTDAYAIVEVNGNGGCYGTDTIYLSTPPFPAINIQGYAPCGNPNSGYLVLSPISGWAPFEYSIDGGTNFQTSSTFSGLGIGTYTITVKDTLNCTYDFPAELTDASTPPTPDFLLSTYNFETDTIALIDVSNPSPDSVHWIFPSSFIVIDENDTLPLVILPDTGTFTVTMDAYYGTCISSASKVIYVSEFDTTLATLYNSNGIKSIELYPNPTSGDFTITVEFYKKQNATISITDMNGIVFESLSFNEVDLITEQIQMTASAGTGTYVLRVAAEFDSAYITFILNR